MICFNLQAFVTAVSILKTKRERFSKIKGSATKCKYKRVQLND